jgi:hypothetical protein
MTRIQLIRDLRATFSAKELTYLQSVDSFTDSLVRHDGSPKSLKAVITLGETLLSQSDHRGPGGTRSRQAGSNG